jgi:hypothetical protein
VFFPGRMSPEKTDFSWFRRLRPAEVCDACPTGRVRWDGKAGGCLWGVPCRASPLGRKGRRMPMGCALPGQSVGAERPADAYGVCPAGRVRWGGKAGGCLWGVPYRASPLGRKGRRMPAGVPCRASPLERKGRRMPAGQSVGMERPVEVCDAFWVRCGNGFPAAGPCFRFGKIFLKLPHIWRGSSVIQGERGRSHHGLGGPI